MNLIAYSRGFFIRFFGDRQPEVISKLNQLIALLAIVGSPFGKFPAMMRISVNVFEQRQKFVAKSRVAMSATQTSLIAKFLERNFAGRADKLFEGFEFGFAQSGTGFNQAATRQAGFRPTGVVHEVVKALFAEVNFMRLTFDQLGDVVCRHFRAAIALHEI